MEAIMIDTIRNFLFLCGHRHLTRPFTPLGQNGVPRGGTYVVCLDCTRQFAYDLEAMRMGKAIDHTHDACVIPPALAAARKTRLTFALGVAVPAAVLIGAALKLKRQPTKK
jgi:hypothetical protein